MQRLGDYSWRRVAVKSVLQASEKKLSIPTFTRGRQQCQSGWPYILFTRYAQRIRNTQVALRDLVEAGNS